jgi:hypothetical protein
VPPIVAVLMAREDNGVNGGANWFVPVVMLASSPSVPKTCTWPTALEPTASSTRCPMGRHGTRWCKRRRATG